MYSLVDIIKNQEDKANQNIFVNTPNSRNS